jgi:hypothetical protein
MTLVGPSNQDYKLARCALLAKAAESCSGSTACTDEPLPASAASGDPRCARADPADHLVHAAPHSAAYPAPACSQAARRAAARARTGTATWWWTATRWWSARARAAAWRPRCSRRQASR